MSDTMAANQRRVWQGGLMRCCLATIAEAEHDTEVGDVLDCKYEPPGNHNMVVGDDGNWKWNRP